jgi:hypothetical protein
MRSAAAYLPLNPFVDLSVGEAELWGSRAWLDVPQIHSQQFEALKSAVAMVRASRRTQMRFIRGVGGSGKSHLFARLRREMGDSILYAYAPNPPLQPDALEGFLLSKLVNSLRHRARKMDGSEAPYSQLRLLAYALLRPVIQQNITIEDLHDSWLSTSSAEQKNLLHDAMLLLEADYPDVPRGVLRCLLNILREDKENLAGQWLAGTTYFTEADLKYLGEPEPLGREVHGTVIHLLGKLAASAHRPFVLVLDQLDLVTTLGQLDEIQRLLFALIDQSENWVVLIGLVGDRFKFWEENLNQALRGRVGVPDLDHPESFKLPTIEVTPIVTADKELLVRRRLESPSLQRQRQLDDMDSTLYPLADEDLSFLTRGGAVYARHLLAASSERFSQAVMKGGTMARVALAEKVDALLEEGIEQSRSEAHFLSAIELGERVRELIQLLAPPPVTVRSGNMRQSLRTFDGSDHGITSQMQEMRLLASDATRNSLISVLQRVSEDPGHTLLVRNAAAGVSGQVVLELFNRFKETNHFHYVTVGEAATLIALGSLLASLREGNYEQMLTDPPATRDNVLTVLRESGRVLGLRVWQAAQAALKGKPAPAPKPPAIDETKSAVATLPKPNVSPTKGVPKMLASPENGSKSIVEPPPPSVRTTPLVPRLSNGLATDSGKATDRVPAPLPKELPFGQGVPEHTVETIKVLLRTERWMELRRLMKRLEELRCPCEIAPLRRALRMKPLSEHASLHPTVEDDHSDTAQIVLWNEAVL